MAETFGRVALVCPPFEELTYQIPASLEGCVTIGDTVKVPLNRRQVTGLVVALESEPRVPNPKQIIAKVPFVPRVCRTLLKLCHWAADYYLCKLGIVLCSALPAQIVKGQRTLWLQAMPSERDCLSNAEAELVSVLAVRKKMPLYALRKKFHGKETETISQLLERNLVSFGCSRLNQGASRGAAAEQSRGTAPTLTQEQQAAVTAISGVMEKREFCPILLHGVTGSGKTEIYLRAIDIAWERGLGSLVMVPEIGLTPQLAERIKARFGDRVAILHSGMTETQRRMEWEKIESGHCAVVVGTRSAIFAPVKDLGLIIVDEEHDSSYKQEDGFRYNGRDLAVVRARIVRCAVILGSATPAIETYHNAVRGRYLLISLRHRVGDKPHPSYEWVDLRKSFRMGENGLLSAELIRNLESNSFDGKQSLLFLNRRGFAQYLLCTLCGFVLACPNCSVSLRFHRTKGQAICHYCNHTTRAPDLCPQCGSARLRGMGFGTERLQSEIAKLFPQKSIQRMDRDTVRKRGAYQTILSDWRNARTQILVGTQMVTKGHDIPGVTLVGILLAEAALNLPDFRAAERTFQLITQVAGRAGRGNEKGKVIVQTFNPDHYVFECIRQGGMDRFFREEIKIRRTLGYPPFARLVQIRLEGVDEDRVVAAAKDLGLALKERWQSTANTRILGPAPAPLIRIRNRYRWHILLKGKEARDLRCAALEARDLIFPKLRTAGVRMSVDVDPIHML